MGLRIYLTYKTAELGMIVRHKAVSGVQWVITEFDGKYLKVRVHQSDREVWTKGEPAHDAPHMFYTEKAQDNEQALPLLNMGDFFTS